MAAPASLGTGRTVYTEACPDKVAVARQRGRLIVFAGSGVSAPTRRPGWHALVSGLIKVAEGAGMSGPRATAVAELHSMSLEVAHTKFTPAIVKELVDSQVGAGTYTQCLKTALEPLEADNASRYHDLLFSLKPSAFVTTNYDICFENRAAEEGLRWEPIVVEEESVASGYRLQPKCVYHLHGVSTLEKTMILGLDEYARLYRQKSTANDFLQTLFSRYTILFVGCSMTDEEILGELVRSGSGDRHHALVARETAPAALFRALGSSVTEYDCHKDPDGRVTDHYGLEKMLSRWARDLNFIPATGPSRAVGI